MCIVNLDSSDKPGSHWVALYKEDKLYFYDSFGRSYKEILPSLKGDVIDTERDPEQKVVEDNCGQRCLAALKMFWLFGKNVAKYL